MFKEVKKKIVDRIKFIYYLDNMNQKNSTLPVVFTDDDLGTDIIEEPNFKKAMQVFETDTFKDTPDLQSGSIATGYVDQLNSEGYTPDQIATKTNLPVQTVKNSLNRILNSDLGKVDSDTKNLRRIEMDDYVLKQLKRLEDAIDKYLTKCEENDIEPDMQVLTKFQAQVTKLIDVRSKLWGLNEDSKNTKGTTDNPSLIGGRIRSTVDKETSTKIADFIIGVVNKE